MEETFIVFVTAPKANSATLAKGAVEQKLAACAQCLPSITSYYIWEGKTQEDEETLILFKTNAAKLEAIEAFIQAEHPYEVPQFVAIPAAKVSGPYASWLQGCLA